MSGVDASGTSSGMARLATVTKLHFETSLSSERNMSAQTNLASETAFNVLDKNFTAVCSSTAANLSKARGDDGGQTKETSSSISSNFNTNSVEEKHLVGNLWGERGNSKSFYEVEKIAHHEELLLRRGEELGSKKTLHKCETSKDKVQEVKGSNPGEEIKSEEVLLRRGGELENREQEFQLVPVEAESVKRALLIVNKGQGEREEVLKNKGREVGKREEEEAKRRRLRDQKQRELDELREEEVARLKKSKKRRDEEIERVKQKILQLERAREELLEGKRAREAASKSEEEEAKLKEEATSKDEEEMKVKREASPKEVKMRMEEATRKGRIQLQEGDDQPEMKSVIEEEDMGSKGRDEKKDFETSSNQETRKELLLKVTNDGEEEEEKKRKERVARLREEIRRRRRERIEKEEKLGGEAGGKESEACFSNIVVCEEKDKVNGTERFDQRGGKKQNHNGSRSAAVDHHGEVASATVQKDQWMKLEFSHIYKQPPTRLNIA